MIIDDMVPGRELDVEVAKKVFGLTVFFDEEGEPIAQGISLNVMVPHFSTDFNSAWLITHEFDSFKIEKLATTHKGFMVTFNERLLNYGPYTRCHGFGDELPEAICKAALEAKELINED